MKQEFYSFSNPRKCHGYKVEGSTLTIPNLAPTLIEIINSSISGDGVPLTSHPLYDDSEDSGFARCMANSTPLSEKFHFAYEEATKENDAKLVDKEADDVADEIVQSETKQDI